MNDESKIGSITVRAFLAIILVLCACYLMIVMKEVEKLFGLAMMALGFYFGQKSVPIIPGGSDAKVTSTISATVSSIPSDKSKSGQPINSGGAADDKPA